jgi:hypothetical protein
MIDDKGPSFWTFCDQNYGPCARISLLPSGTHEDWPFHMHLRARPLLKRDYLFSTCARNLIWLCKEASVRLPIYLFVVLANICSYLSMENLTRLCSSREPALVQGISTAFASRHQFWSQLSFTIMLLRLDCPSSQSLSITIASTASPLRRGHLPRWSFSDAIIVPGNPFQSWFVPLRSISDAISCVAVYYSCSNEDFFSEQMVLCSCVAVGIDFLPWSGFVETSFPESLAWCQSFVLPLSDVSRESDVFPISSLLLINTDFPLVSNSSESSFKKNLNRLAWSVCYEKSNLVTGLPLVDFGRYLWLSSKSIGTQVKNPIVSRAVVLSSMEFLATTKSAPADSPAVARGRSVTWNRRCQTDGAEGIMRILSRMNWPEWELRRSQTEWVFPMGDPWSIARTIGDLGPWQRMSHDI